MRIVYSLDLHQLEAILVERIARRADGGLAEPLLVLVPTDRLARHLKRCVLESRPAVLGLQVLTHYGFLRRVLEHALEPPPRDLPDRAQRHLLSTLRQSSSSDTYGEAYSGARKAVASSFRDLREAGISAAEIKKLTGEPDLARDLCATYEEFETALEALQARGWTDRAGLVKRVLPHVSNYLTRRGIKNVFHHGAYELTGVNLQLLDAVNQTAEVTFFLPTELEPTVCSYARRFVTTSRERMPVALDTPPVETSASSPAAWISRIRELYEDQPRQSGQADAVKKTLVQDDLLASRGPELEIRHTQGAEAELRVAALRALTLHARDEVPWHEIAIVARSLEPYAPFLERTFDDLGVPFSTSATLPLRQAPVVKTFLALLRVYAGDFERAAVIDLLRSEALRLEDGPVSADEVDRWDLLSRQARIVRHLETWKELPQLADRLGYQRAGQETEADAETQAKTASLTRLLSVLDELAMDAAEWRRAQDFGAHRRVLEAIGGRRLLFSENVVAPPENGTAENGTAENGTAENEAAAHSEEELSQTNPSRARPSRDHRPGDRPHPQIVSLLTSLDALHEIESLQFSEKSQKAVTVDEVTQILEETAAETSFSPTKQDDAGVRVLDLMQARGLTHRVVQWIGFQDGLFPRRGHADPFLTDDLRERLREVTKKPIAVKKESDDEERLLLAMTLAAAKERVIVSYARADEGGRKIGRSSALREIARAFTGRADVRKLLEDSLDNLCRPERIPAHAGDRVWSLCRSKRFGCVPTADSIVATAIRARDPTALASAALRKLASERDARAVTGDELALQRVRHFETFTPGQGSAEMDCLTGRGIDPGRELSPTSIEKLTRCPQAFFLSYVLNVRDLDDVSEAHKIEVKVLGTAVHDTLQALYEALDRERLFEGPGAKATSRALGLLPDLWSATLKRAAGPSFRRLVGLYQLLSDRWLLSLQRFVEVDIREMLARGVTRLDLEQFHRATLNIGKELQLQVRGRFDRVVRGSEGIDVTDYKTGGDLSDKVSPTSIVKGKSLQLPLYREILATKLKLNPSEIKARLRGVGPEFEAEKDVAELKWLPEIHAGFLDSLRIALELARAGQFPLQPDTGACRYCDYRKTCRKDHEPTLQRLRNNQKLRDFYDLQRKTKSATTLEALRKGLEEAP